MATRTSTHDSFDLARLDFLPDHIDAHVQSSQDLRDPQRTNFSASLVVHDAQDGGTYRLTAQTEQVSHEPLVNWPALGAQSITSTWVFVDALQHAITVAEVLAGESRRVSRERALAARP